MSETEVSPTGASAGPEESSQAEGTADQTSADPTIGPPDTLVEGPVADREPSQDHPTETGDSDVAEDPTPDEPQAPVEPTWVRYDIAAEEAITAAVEAIRAGQSIVVPTDTVYGIAADPFSEAAMQHLLAAKQRGPEVPVAVLISDGAMVGSFVQYLDLEAEKLAERWWPGPLTMIFRAQDSLRMDLGLTRGTIAVRVPDHEFTRRLLRRTGPLAVSSANVHARPAATTIDEAIEQLGNEVAVYLDDGESPGGAASTIVDFSHTTLGEMVREGAVSLAELHEVSAYIAWQDPADDELDAVDPSDDEPADDDLADTADDDPADTADDDLADTADDDLADTADDDLWDTADGDPVEEETDSPDASGDGAAETDGDAST